jgi:hypothetical protein
LDLGIGEPNQYQRAMAKCRRRRKTPQQPRVVAKGGTDERFYEDLAEQWINVDNQVAADTG